MPFERHQPSIEGGVLGLGESGKLFSVNPFCYLFGLAPLARFADLLELGGSFGFEADGDRFARDFSGLSPGAFAFTPSWHRIAHWRLERIWGRSSTLASSRLFGLASLLTGMTFLEGPALVGP